MFSFILYNIFFKWYTSIMISRRDDDYDKWNISIISISVLEWTYLYLFDSSIYFNSIIFIKLGRYVYSEIHKATKGNIDRNHACFK